jgi:hypothetical protein
MKLHYYPETDSLYIELKAGPGAETREIAPGLNWTLTPPATSWVWTSTARSAVSI